MVDKIVNHYFTTKYLIPKLDKKLDDNLEEIADMFNMLFTNVPA